MEPARPSSPKGNAAPCANCGTGQPLDFQIRMAFQPIVDARTRSIYGYEALVRTAEGGGALEVLARVTPEQLYRFDQACRVKAIETAARLGLQGYLSINFLPNAVYEPATCIQLTLQAARRHGFPTERLIFETAESEQVRDEAHLTRIFRDYRERGFLTAMDDFGAGYAGLKLLANFQPDLIKLDMALIRDIDRDPARQAIARGVVASPTNWAASRWPKAWRPWRNSATCTAWASPCSRATCSAAPCSNSWARWTRRCGPSAWTAEAAPRLTSSKGAAPRAQVARPHAARSHVSPARSRWSPPRAARTPAPCRPRRASVPAVQV